MFVYADSQQSIVASPVNFNPELQGVRITDQGDTSECTVNAVSNGVEQQMIIEGMEVPEDGFSTDWLWDMARITDNKEAGLHIETVLEIVKQYGMIPEGMYSNDQEKNLEIAAQYKIDSYELVKKATYADTLSEGSIIILNTTYQKQNWKDGFLTSESENINGLHATYLVDYNPEEELFIGVNSWGTKWGYDGLYYMTDDYLMSDVLGGYSIKLSQPVANALN